MYLHQSWGSQRLGENPNSDGSFYRHIIISKSRDVPGTQTHTYIMRYKVGHGAVVLRLAI